MTANLQRDAKKQRRPFSTADFTFFHDQDKDGPENDAAAAYWVLLESDRLPNFALFCMDDMRKGKGRGYPSDPAVVGDGVLLLAPHDAAENKITGTLIAEQKVSNKQVAVKWEGQQFLVSVPKFEGFVTAMAGAELTILREMAPDTVR